MATPSYRRSLTSAFKRLKTSTITILPQTRYIQSSSSQQATAITRSNASSLPSSLERELSQLRLPLAVQATYLNPLRREPETNSTSADLQLRSYSVRNLEVFADFAMRAAYFLKLAAKGPRPLPRKTERFTVPRSNFVHKKSQENFERVTLRRQIKILGGHPETVALWLAFIKKHRYYGVGMKANVYEDGSLDTAEDLDAEAKRIAETTGEITTYPMFTQRTTSKVALGKGDETTQNRILDQPAKGAFGPMAPSGGSQSVPSARARLNNLVVGPYFPGERPKKIWHEKSAQQEERAKDGRPEQ